MTLMPKRLAPLPGRFDEGRSGPVAEEVARLGANEHVHEELTTAGWCLNQLYAGSPRSSRMPNTCLRPGVWLG